MIFCIHNTKCYKWTAKRKNGKLRKLETWEEKWLIARHKNLIPKIDTKNSRAVVVFQIFLEVFENIS